MNDSILSKAKIKYIRSLHNLKFRQKYHKYIAEGDKICKVILSKEQKIEYVVCTKNWMEKNQSILTNHRDKILIADKKDIATISLLKTPSEVVMICDYAMPNDKVVLKNESAIYLDNIQDPGNLGTMIRTADWFGFKFIVLSKESVSFYNPKVIQAAMGSHVNVSPFVMNLDELKEINPSEVIGTLLDATPLNRFTFPIKSIVVIGNEGKGISPENMSLLDKAVTISGNKNRIAESLNASMALGIILSRMS